MGCVQRGRTCDGDGTSEQIEECSVTAPSQVELCGGLATPVLDTPDGAVKTLIVGFVDAVEKDGEVVFDHRTGDIQ